MDYYFNLNGGKITLGLYETQHLASAIELMGGQDEDLRVQSHRDGTPELPPAGSQWAYGIKPRTKFADGDFLAEAPAAAWTAPSNAAGWLINHGGGYAVGATALTVDTGSGEIYAGDQLTIGSYSYLVTIGRTANVVTIAAPGLLATVADNAAIGVTSCDGFFTAELTLDTAAIREELAIDGDDTNDVEAIDEGNTQFQYWPPGAARPRKSLRFQTDIDNWVIKDDEASPTGVKNSVTVVQGISAVANGTALRTAVLRAAALTPNGAALSATNRSRVLLSPGVYDLVTTPLLLDVEFVDLVGLTGNPRDVLITSQVVTNNTGTIRQTASDVHLHGLTIENTAATQTPAATDAAAYAPDSDLYDTVLEDCIFSDGGGASWSTRLGVTYGGRYVRCLAGNSAFGCLTGADFSGTAIDCEAGSSSFANGAAFLGTATRCVAGANSYGKSGTLSGYLYYCRLTSGTFQTVSGGGKTRYCLTGTDTADNQG